MKLKAGLFLVCTFLSLSGLAISHVGNGGGGLLIQGKYMTFYSAHVLIEKTPLGPEEIPGMSFLRDQISQLAMDNESRGHLFDMIFPRTTRRYFKADKNQISEKDRKALIAEYSKLMKVPTKQVVLFALTNPKTGNTFLMPEFFKLSTATAQAAILFHESSWVQNPEQSYAQVVAAEESSQAYFENPSDAAKYLSFYRMLSSLLEEPRLTAKAGLAFDQKLHLPWGLDAKNHRFLISELVGEKFLRCYFRDYRETPTPYRTTVAEVCTYGALVDYLTSVALKYPNSLFVQGLLDYANEPKWRQLWLTTFSPYEKSADHNVDYRYVSNLDDRDFLNYIDQLYMVVGGPGALGDFEFKLEVEDGTTTGWLDLTVPGFFPPEFGDFGE